LARAISEAGQRRPTVWFGSTGGFITHPDQIWTLPPLGGLRGGAGVNGAIQAPPPKLPPAPVSRDVSPSEPQGLAVPSSMSNDTLEQPPEAERVHGVSVQLDIAVERRRSYWWRLALTFVARRLR
jgi:hypothetical protein